jgi:hypothetical protein
MKRLEKITQDYWAVSKAIKHPQEKGITCEVAFKKLSSADRLRPTEWRLMDLMHIIRYDLIEGNTEWRKDERRKTPRIAPVMLMNINPRKVKVK